MDRFLVITSTILLGAGGWITLEFLGRPIRNFFDLRREIRHEMLRLANVEAPNNLIEWEYLNPDEHDRRMRPLREAQATFRSMGSRLMAFGETEWPANRALKWAGYEHISAGLSLIKLSEDYSEQERAKHRSIIAKALKFPF